MKTIMKNSLSALVVGFVFSVGLGFSGMTQPEKVFGFLDVFGKWDPSLIFVMIGAIIFHLITFRIIKKNHKPLFSNDWHIPTKKEITPALVLGSVIFGIGWGLGGYCPGPAVTSLASFEIRPIVFVVSMLMGMFFFKILDSKYKLKR